MNSCWWFLNRSTYLIAKICEQQKHFERIFSGQLKAPKELSYYQQIPHYFSWTPELHSYPFHFEIRTANSILDSLRSFIVWGYISQGKIARNRTTIPDVSFTRSKQAANDFFTTVGIYRWIYRVDIISFGEVTVGWIMLWGKEGSAKTSNLPC